MRRFSIASVISKPFMEVIPYDCLSAIIKLLYNHNCIRSVVKMSVGSVVYREKKIFEKNLIKFWSSLKYSLRFITKLEIDRYLIHPFKSLNNDIISILLKKIYFITKPIKHFI